MCFSHNTASAQFDETPNLYGIGARFVNCELQVQLTIVIICQDKSVAEVANVICLSSSVVFVCCLWKFNNSWTIAKITLKPVLRSSIFPSQFKVFHLDELHRFIFNLSAVIFLWFFRVCSFARHYSILHILAKSTMVDGRFAMRLKTAAFPAGRSFVSPSLCVYLSQFARIVST